jgi:hypothetical protein
MNYPLDVELNELLEDAIGDVVSQMEDAIENIRRYSQPRLVHTVDVDIQELLAEQKAVALVFTTADVKKLRPDLTDEQTWEILQMFEAAAEDCPDPLYETMSQIADMHFPKHRKLKLAEVGKIIEDYDPHGDERENLVDLLTDLMHWGKGFGEPFDEFRGSAEMHFAAETKKGA